MKKKRRRRLPKKKKYPKTQCDPPPSRDTKKPFKMTVWEPQIEDLPPGIQPVSRIPGGHIYSCINCGLVESKLLRSEEDLLQFINWHREKHPECFDDGSNH